MQKDKPKLQGNLKSSPDFTNLTMDNRNPKITSSFIGIKKGNNSVLKPSHNFT
jgi:hypothetical protein